MVTRHSSKKQARGGTAGPAGEAAAPAPTLGCHLHFQFHMLVIKPPPCHILLQGKFMCRLFLPQALWQKDFTRNSEIRAEKNRCVHRKEVHNMKDKPKHVWYHQSY